MYTLVIEMYIAVLEKWWFHDSCHVVCRLSSVGDWLNRSNSLWQGLCEGKPRETKMMFRSWYHIRFVVFGSLDLPLLHYWVVLFLPQVVRPELFGCSPARSCRLSSVLAISVCYPFDLESQRLDGQMYGLGNIQEAFNPDQLRFSLFIRKPVEDCN